MNDSQMLVWIAEHLLTFQPMVNTAYMSYLDDEGYSKEVRVDCEGECIDQLKACINKVAGK